MPPGWRQSRVKYLGSFLNGYPFKPEDWSSEGRPILRIQDLSGLSAEPNRFRGEIDPRYMVKRGDILISWSASLGVYRWSGEESWLNQHIFKVELDSSIVYADFFCWLAEWFMAELSREAHGSTMQHLTADAFGGFPVLLPPTSHQAAIANYLGSEATRLDALVNAKQCALNLLAEKRKAIIATAVTRGLDPKATLRDSGVPWLGEIPAHWEHRNLRSCCTAIQTGGTPAPEFLDYDGDDGLDWLTPSDFSESLVPQRSVRRVAPGALSAGDLKMFPAGTVLVVGIGATLGKVGLLSRPASANQQVNALIPRDDIDSSFLAYEMSVLTELLRVSANTATLPILNQQRMGDVPILVPPLGEQQPIVEHIVCQTAKLDAVRSATERTIALLKERRAALIAAAVTGQLDLRTAA